MKLSYYLPLAVLLVLTSSSFGAMTVIFEEVGSDVVATYSGSINTDSFDTSFTVNEPTAQRNYDGDEAWFRNFAPGELSVGVVDFIESPSFVTALGGTEQTADSFSGDVFGIYNSGAFEQVFLPDGYVSGTPINGSMTFNGETINSLGLKPGDHVWEWTNTDQTATDSATFTVVPEPSSTALLGLTTLGLVLRRRN